MKTLTVLISGQLQSRMVRVEPGATAGDLVQQLGIPDYRIVYLFGENPLPPQTDLHKLIRHGRVILAFPDSDFQPGGE